MLDFAVLYSLKCGALPDSRETADGIVHSAKPWSRVFQCTTSNPNPGGSVDEDVFNLELRKFLKRF
jgi:hypothetical protein